MEKASTARGSNDPHPPTTMDINEDANYWYKKKQNSTYWNNS